MKRVAALICALAAVFALPLSGRAAAVKAGDYSEVGGFSGIIGSLAVVKELSAADECASALAAGANTAAVKADRSLALEGGGTLADIAGGNFPLVVEVDTGDAAVAVAEYMKGAGHEDYTVMSADPDAVKAARETHAVCRGALDFRGRTVSTKQMVAETNRCWAKICVADDAALDAAAVTDLRAQYLAVWADNPSAVAGSMAETILKGVNGVIAAHPEAAAEAAATYFSAANSLTRAPFLVAHRGTGTTHGIEGQIPLIGAAENTLRGAKLSYEAGADAVEIDIRLTKDKEIVNMHEEDLSATTTGTGKVSERTLAEIRSYRLRGAEGTPFEGDRVPTFEEYLQEFRGKDFRIVVELKDYTRELVQRAAALIRGYGMESQCVFIGFSLTSAAYVKELIPEIGFSYLGGDLRVFNLTPEGYHKDVNLQKSLQRLYSAIGSYSSVLSPAYTCTDETVMEQAGLRGTAYWLWTLQNSIDYDAWKIAGATGITVDNILRFEEVTEGVRAENLSLIAGESGHARAFEVKRGGGEKEITGSGFLKAFVLSGDAVEIAADGKISAVAAGTAKVVYRYRAIAENNAEINYYSQPVTVTVSAAEQPDAPGKKGCGKSAAGIAASAAALAIAAAAICKKR